MSLKKAFEEMSLMSTAIISDAMSGMGLKHRTLHSAVKPLSPDMRLAGPAATAECYPGGTYGTEKLIESLNPGEVAVLDGKGFSEAVLWGEIFTLMAMVKKAGGAVIDGAVRDVPEIIELKFPMFARHITPACGTGDELGRVNVPVSCAGVLVRPGDFMFGDALGAVCVPAERLEETYRACLDVLRKEEKMIKKLKKELKH